MTWVTTRWWCSRKSSWECCWRSLRDGSGARITDCALLRRWRFRHRFLQREVGFRPAVGSVGIPDDVDVAHAENALRGVPRHPAGAQTIDEQWFGAITFREAREVGLQIVLGHRCKGAVPGIG